MVLQLIPSIKVHCWGGFGSQLFALALCNELKTKFPTRNLILILHSSGVSKRVPEIQELLVSVPYKIRDDYRRMDLSTLETGSFKLRFDLRNYFLNFFKLILKTIGLLSSLDQPGNLVTLKPWVISIRGHYSNLPFSSSTFENILSMLKDKNSLPFSKSILLNSLVIQYRLGDLLHLPTKSYIEPKFIVNQAKYILNKDIVPTVVILSDTVESARSLIPKLALETKYLSLNPISTIFCALESKHFIGTNSKLSLWVALFRHFDNKSSYLPRCMSSAFKSICPSSSLITYYEDK